MAGEHYAEFIDEAFVKPIRSVLIIDDDYPTLDEILDSAVAERDGRAFTQEKAWHKNPDRIKKVIARFRTPSRPLLVDIHDGNNVPVRGDVKVAAHLHQSDLLVLDYQLDKSKPQDGSRAIEIIRSLARNNHFNLVVVHTSEKLDQVFQQIVIGLLTPCRKDLSTEDISRVEELIDNREDDEDGASDRVRKSISIDQYLHSRLQPTTFLRTMAKNQQPYGQFVAECEAAKWRGDDRRKILLYLLSRIQNELLTKLNVDSGRSLSWSTGSTKWIKADSIFIAFSEKGDEDDLIEELKAALNAWNPQPSRLFLAKLRAEMDEHGVVAQASALGNTYALAHWYARLLNSDGAERRWLISESISRHSEQLLGSILPHVENFANRLISAEVIHENAVSLCEEHFKVNLADDATRMRAEREHNAFVCSEAPQGWHLTTGHIFTMNDDFWVCLSPACDMVPSQLSNADKESFGGRLPFIAIKLQPIRDGKEIPDIQSNRYIFLPLNGSVKGFCFNDFGRESSSPVWRTLFAEQQGLLTDDFKFKAVSTETGSRNLVSKKYEAIIVRQLRYEYALNLMNRLGSSLTRVGLDFASRNVS